jgi:hypothetical protein
MTNGLSASSSPRFLIGGIWLAAIVSVLSIAALVWQALTAVKSGHALDMHRTFWLIEFNAIEFLVFIGATAIALLVGLLFRLREWRELEALREKRHG